MDGILNIYKEKGYTSHDVVAIIRKILNQKKVGHTGTLDPEAEGVLPICIGKATKTVEYLTDKKKRYLSVVKFGITTSTGDSTGEIIKSTSVDLDKNKVENIVKSFIGEYNQIPPMYSAIKVKGKKLYELARQGKVIDRKPRKVYIYNINITSFISKDEIEIDVECSKGTYIRTLCEDIGNALGFGAHMKSLIRTQVGMFNIDNSIKLNELKEIVKDKKLDKYIIKIEEIFSQYSLVKIKSEGEKILKNGNKIKFNYIEYSVKKLTPEEIVRVYDYSEKFIGIYKVIVQGESYYLKPMKLFL
ncbi:tRNA pseudouridine(55) synthase TruB [Defluviitalea phaphyphila]|uniref:tRNA pseudouridine(55) synthase TruB n=1 Tax=Defluviitalea phaphyphila TaxID=1473580 RepID=UPI0007314B46|nr:tRNA pseudouridine(55) synthase TruB [Defluviitalea phaphyphila]